MHARGWETIVLYALDVRDAGGDAYLPASSQRECSRLGSNEPKRFPEAHLRHPATKRDKPERGFLF